MYKRQDHGFLALRQRVEGEQHGGGVVADDGRGVLTNIRGRAAGHQFGEQAGNQIVAVAAPAAGEIVFQRTGRTRLFDHQRYGLFGKQRAAKVGVQHLSLIHI